MCFGKSVLKVFFFSFCSTNSFSFVKEKIYTLCSRTDLIILRGQKSHVDQQIFMRHLYFFSENVVESLPCRNTETLNVLPNDKILYCTKLKGFTDNNMKVTQKFKFVFRRGEIIMGYQHFLFFPQCFQRFTQG